MFQLGLNKLFYGGIIVLKNNSLFSWPSFTEAEANAVKDVVLSNKVNYWTGQEGREFEKEFAAFSDCLLYTSPSPRDRG